MRCFACLLFVMALVGCSPGRGLPELPKLTQSPYRLGAGDVVRLITVGDDTLTGEFRVSDSGMIALPLLGTIQSTGLTPDELADRVRNALVKGNLYTAPSVSVEITTYRPIYVLGEVAKPGEYPYQPGMTMVTAAAVAGGFTYRAIVDYASVVRSDTDGVIEGKASRQTLVQPGDVITFFERRF